MVAGVALFIGGLASADIYESSSYEMPLVQEQASTLVVNHQPVELAPLHGFVVAAGTFLVKDQVRPTVTRLRPPYHPPASRPVEPQPTEPALTKVETNDGPFERPGPADLPRLRNCESGGNYQINTGNGFYGAYQFDQGTWHGLGYSGLPSTASPTTQDTAATRLEEQRGWQPWPGCSRKLGLVAHKQ